jgi:hypothetical protein
MFFDGTLRPEKYGSVKLDKVKYDFHWMSIKRWLEEERNGSYRRCYHHNTAAKAISEVEYIFTDPHVAFEFKLSFA